MNMAILEIPLRNDVPAYTFQIELEGVTYTLTVSFNARMNRWTMDVADSNGDLESTG
jgi:hypothetical protein